LSLGRGLDPSRTHTHRVGPKFPQGRPTSAPWADRR
jgi:hypothetical protein